MPANRICQFFDRKLRQTKSISSLSLLTSQNDVGSSQRSRPKSRDSLSVATEYNFNQCPRPSRYPSPFLRAARAVSPHRASTTPLIHPPDELFLRMVRRRSASARLEQHTTRDEQVSDTGDAFCQRGTLPTPVAVAYALPPQYFDLPPAYESPQQTQQGWSGPPIRSRATIVKPRGTELFLGDELHSQIDQVIAEFRGFVVTGATPERVSTPEATDAPVSPINEIDNMYLELRRERHQQKQRLRLTTT